MKRFPLIGLLTAFMLASASVFAQKNNALAERLLSTISKSGNGDLLISVDFKNLPEEHETLEFPGRSELTTVIRHIDPNFDVKKFVKALSGASDVEGSMKDFCVYIKKAYPLKPTFSKKFAAAPIKGGLDSGIPLPVVLRNYTPEDIRKIVARSKSRANAKTEKELLENLKENSFRPDKSGKGYWGGYIVGYNGSTREYALYSPSIFKSENLAWLTEKELALYLTETIAIRVSN